MITLISHSPKPVKFNERVRPGHSQLICGAFSEGGSFYAVGGVDHTIRIYSMDGPPCKIEERTCHSDCVDSIQWSHSALCFASGSRDGLAFIWRWEAQRWRTIKLDMALNQVGSSTTATTTPVTNKVLVTMVGWSRDDRYVVTCSSDHLTRVWSAVDGALVRVIGGHTDDAFVVEAHPHDANVVLTAGHDGAFSHVFSYIL